MDIQGMMDAMSESWRDTRSEYHLTLGQAIEELKKLPADAKLCFDHNVTIGPKEAMSYRGYYSDLCFDNGPITTVKEFLAKCEESLGKTYTGYKGGDFVMDAKTPLWNDEYGTSNNRAIMGITMMENIAVLVTKQIDI